MSSKTNVIEWKNPGPDDIIYVHPFEDIRWGSQLIVHEFETALFLRDGKLYDSFLPGSHQLTTQNLPILTRVLRVVAGYGETPFKAKVIFVSLKQLRGKFGLNMRIKIGQKASWPTELQANGDYWFRIDDPVLFLTQVVGGAKQLTSEDVSVFIRDFLIQQTMQNFAEYDAITIYNKLNEVTPKIRSYLGEEFRQRGIQLLNIQFGGVGLPLFEKMEKEDPTYGLPLIAAIQSGNEEKVLEITKIVESMRGIGKSPGAGFAAGVMAMPYVFGAPPSYPPAAQQPTQAPQAAPPQAEKVDLMAKLKALKEALDSGLITKEEHDAMKADLLDKWKKS